MENNVTDAVLALRMFEEALARRPSFTDEGRASARDAELEQLRRGELEAQEPRVEGEAHWARERRLSDQAKRDVLRAKWQSDEFPRDYARRLPFLHARIFVTALAQLSRAIGEMARLDTGDAKTKIVATRERFDAALPILKPIRDLIEHAEDRMRGLGRDKKPITLAPISNETFDVPGGSLLVFDCLIGRYGCTVSDGSLAEADVTDQTLDIAREAVQAIFDAIPWLPGRLSEIS